MKIALLGAESTGKTTLARELAAHFNALGRTAVAVPETLREWCEREQCALAIDEHMAVALEQERRVDEAASQARVVIADTTALMVAIYSAILFDDHPLVRFAIERQRAYDLTLVMGLDLPWVGDGLQRVGPAVQASVDAQVREMLGRAGVAYRVIYGRGEERLRNALAAIDASLAPPASGDSWVWQCDKCSDPRCEHRLFTRLAGGPP